MKFDWTAWYLDWNLECLFRCSAFFSHTFKFKFQAGWAHAAGYVSVTGNNKIESSNRGSNPFPLNPFRMAFINFISSIEAYLNCFPYFNCYLPKWTGLGNQLSRLVLKCFDNRCRYVKYPCDISLLYKKKTKKKKKKRKVNSIKPHQIEHGNIERNKQWSDSR